jgi:hypothetical protein
MTKIRNKSYSHANVFLKEKKIFFGGPNIINKGHLNLQF